MATDIVSQIKAALAEDQRALVIERSNEAEEALAAALREALRHDLPQDTRRDLEQTLSSQAPLCLTSGGAPVIIRPRRMPRPIPREPKTCQRRYSRGSGTMASLYGFYSVSLGPGHRPA